MDEKQWSNNFKGKIFYYHGTAKLLEVVETKSDDQGRVLIPDINICDNELLLINLYNVNTEKEHLDTQLN